MSVDAKLLPCPFCGAEAWLNDYEAKFGDMTVQSRCPQCKFCGCNLGYFTTKAKAVSAWNTRTPHPAPESEGEAFDFVKSVYNETGVTPELRRVYDFYKNTQNERQSGETVAEALREIRAAVQDGNLSQGVRLDIIDKIALRALKGEDQ